MSFEHPLSEKPLAFEIDPVVEAELTEASQKICERLFKALLPLRESFSITPFDTLARVRQCIGALKAEWPENDNHPSKPRFFLDALAPCLKNVRLKIEPLSEEGEFGRVEGIDGGEIVLGLRGIMMAETAEDFDRGIATMTAMIYHEVEHVKFSGANLENLGEGAEASIRYLAHPGEMRAYAKQFAFRYQSQFPGEPFDLDRMQRIAESSHEKNYFLVIARVDKQEQYRAYADLAGVHAEVIRMTTRFVELMNHEDSM